MPFRYNGGLIYSNPLDSTRDWIFKAIQYNNGWKFIHLDSGKAVTVRDINVNESPLEAYDDYRDPVSDKYQVWTLLSSGGKTLICLLNYQSYCINNPGSASSAVLNVYYKDFTDRDQWIQFETVTTTTTNIGNVRYLPFRDGTPIQITQGFLGTYSHSSHYGLDIIPTGGSWDIVATRAGTISYIGWHGSVYGYRICIKYNDGTYGFYNHLKINSETVKTGDVVKGGQKIAVMAGSGGNYNDAYYGAHIDYFEGVYTGTGSNGVGGYVLDLNFADAPNLNLYGWGQTFTSKNAIRG